MRHSKQDVANQFTVLSIAAYHDVFAVEVHVVNGRLERVQELHAARYVEREAERLVLINNDTCKQSHHSVSGLLVVTLQRLSDSLLRVDDYESRLAAVYIQQHSSEQYSVVYLHVQNCIIWSVAVACEILQRKTFRIIVWKIGILIANGALEKNGLRATCITFCFLHTKKNGHPYDIELVLCYCSIVQIRKPIQGENTTWYIQLQMICRVIQRIMLPCQIQNPWRAYMTVQTSIKSTDKYRYMYTGTCTLTLTDLSRRAARCRASRRASAD